MSEEGKRRMPGKPEKGQSEKGKPEKGKPEKGKGPPEKSGEGIIYTSGERSLLVQDGDIFTAAGTHVARLQETVAYDSSGRYVGTLVDNRLVFQDEDSLTFGPLFVPTTNPGLADLENVPHQTLEREVSALRIQDGDVFTAAGTHVARLYETVAYDPSGRYVGTLVDDRLVFQDEDSLTFGPLFVPTTNPSLADLENIAHRTVEREASVNE